MSARLHRVVHRQLARWASSTPLPLSWTPGVRLDSSVADPHAVAAEVNAAATASWRAGELGKAIALQEQAVRIKEQRGDEDLNEYLEELEAMKSGETPPGGD